MTLGTLPFFLNPLANEDHRSQKQGDLERHTHSQTRVVQSHWCEIGIAKDFVRQLLKMSSFNAVVPSWIKMDWVGVEPMTSATALMERRRKRKGVLL